MATHTGNATNQICIHTELPDVTARLIEVGFELGILVRTIETWAAGMNIGTLLHPRNYAGFVAWAEAVRTLREQGIPHGLEALFYEGLEMCVCRRTGVGVLIAQGNSATGDPRRSPSTKYPRGPRSSEVLQAQTWFGFAEPPPTADPDAPELPREIWILLVYREGAEVRAELSTALVVADDGEITVWRERIILPVLSTGSLLPHGDVDLEPAAAADVPLVPRR